MIVISIGTERKMFSDNPTRSRVLEFGKTFEKYHIVVFTKKGSGYVSQNTGNAILYPTNSSNKLMYVIDAIRICFKILKTLSSAECAKTVITTQDPFECGIVGLVVKKIKRIPLHVQIHTDLFAKYFKNTFLQYIRCVIAPYIIKNADAIRTDSDRMKNVIIERKLSSVPAVTLPIYIDTKKYIDSTASTDIHSLFSEKRFVVMMASRLEDEKQIDKAIDFFHRVLNQSTKKIGMVIIGSGSLEEKLKSQVKRLQRENDIKFVAWTNDLVSYYKTADLFLLTSLFEGYALTLVEAMLCKVPILTSDVGVAPQIIKTGKNGWMCNPADWKCFETTLFDVVNDEIKYNAVKQYILDNPYNHAYGDMEYYRNIFVQNIESAFQKK